VRRGTRPTLAPGLDPDRMKMRMFLGSYFAGAFCSEFWWATSQIVTAPIEKKNSISSTVLGLEGRRERFVLFFFFAKEKVGEWFANLRANFYWAREFLFPPSKKKKRIDW
jgi:hypothetical protein